MHESNRMFAYYDKSSDLILPITDVSMTATILKYVPHNKVAYS